MSGGTDGPQIPWQGIGAPLTLVLGGYLTFEYFHPYQHFPEALIYQTADSLDRMLGLK